MEELKIELPKGKTVDWEETAKQHKIILKDVNNKPKSWKEYCQNYPVKAGEVYLDYEGKIRILETNYSGRTVNYDDNIILNEEEALAIQALIKLRHLRKAWIKNENPTSHENNHVVHTEIDTNEIKIITGDYAIGALSFPTKEMALEFKNCFASLIRQAKRLL